MHSAKIMKLETILYTNHSKILKMHSNKLNGTDQKIARCRSLLGEFLHAESSTFSALTYSAMDVISTERELDSEKLWFDHFYLFGIELLIKKTGSFRNPDKKYRYSQIYRANGIVPKDSPFHWYTGLLYASGGDTLLLAKNLAVIFANQDCFYEIRQIENSLALYPEAEETCEQLAKIARNVELTNSLIG